MRYNRLKDGDSLLFSNIARTTKIACCDCGLIHDILVTVLPKKNVRITFKRNSRSTGQMRRWNNIKVSKK